MSPELKSKLSALEEAATQQESKLSILEELIVNEDDRIANLQHAVNELLPPPEPTPPEPDDLLYSADPEVAAAKNFIQITDGKDFSGDQLHYFPTKKYNAAKRLISEDILSRCVFEVDEIRYQLTIPAMKIKGQRYTAVEMMHDPRILRYLVSIQSGGVKQIS